MTKNFDFSHIPDTLERTAILASLNSRRKVYKGALVLQFVEKQIEVEGMIYLAWLPSKLGITILGHPSSRTAGEELLRWYMEKKNIDVYIDQSYFGKGIIIKMSLADFSFEIRISGRALLGNVSHFVDRVLFSVPNLKAFHGTHSVKYTFKQKGTMSANRFFIENEHFKITLDKRFNSDAVQKNLNENGGFGIMYSGQLEKKGGLVSYEEAAEVLNCLNRFLSFINGRRVSAVFIKGKLKKKTIWEDLTSYKNDPFKPVVTWSTDSWSQHYNELWVSFYNHFYNDTYRTILSTAVYWYTEANGNSGVEAKSVLAQAALELIYNWLIKVNKFSLSSEIDASNASGKLRAILHVIMQTSEIPESLKALSTYLVQCENDLVKNPDDRNTKQIVDACTVICQIRNSLVHSDNGNRNKLKLITDSALSDSVSLSMWYIELALLFALNYKGFYTNRCSSAMWGGMDESPPWLAGVGEV